MFHFHLVRQRYKEKMVEEYLTNMLSHTKFVGEQKILIIHLLTLDKCEYILSEILNFQSFQFL